MHNVSIYKTASFAVDDRFNFFSVGGLESRTGGLKSRTGRYIILAVENSKISGPLTI